MFVFEVPGAGVGDVDCAEAGGEDGVDVRLRGVADHPAMVGLPLVGGEGGDVLFLDDVDARAGFGATLSPDFSRSESTTSGHAGQCEKGTAFARSSTLRFAGAIADQADSKRLFSSPDCRIMLNKVPRLKGS